MPHFLIKKEEIKDGFIQLIDSENLHHLTRVLRVKKNQKLKFIDENKNIYYCVIEEVDKNTLKANIEQKIISNRVLETKLYLIQSILASADSQSLLIANATQTGVKGIYPVISDNVSVSISQVKNKVEKWNKVAYENFKQCERADIPTVFEIMQLKEVLSKFKPENVLIFAEKFENYTLNNCLSGVDKNNDIALVVGPEGGFSDNEFDYFIKSNFKLITLGKMIYKAPNAVVAGVSNIVSRIENV